MDDHMSDADKRLMTRMVDTFSRDRLPPTSAWDEIYARSTTTAGEWFGGGTRTCRLSLVGVTHIDGGTMVDEFTLAEASGPVLFAPRPDGLAATGDEFHRMMMRVATGLDPETLRLAEAGQITSYVNIRYVAVHPLAVGRRWAKVAAAALISEAACPQVAAEDQMTLVVAPSFTSVVVGRIAPSLGMASTDRFHYGIKNVGSTLQARVDDLTRQLGHHLARYQQPPTPQMALNPAR